MRSNVVTARTGIGTYKGVAAGEQIGHLHVSGVLRTVVGDHDGEGDVRADKGSGIVNSLRDRKVGLVDNSLFLLDSDRIGKHPPRSGEGNVLLRRALARAQHGVRVGYQVVVRLAIGRNAFLSERRFGARGDDGPQPAVNRRTQEGVLDRHRTDRNIAGDVIERRTPGDNHCCGDVLPDDAVSFGMVDRNGRKKACQKSSCVNNQAGKR